MSTADRFDKRHGKLAKMHYNPSVNTGYREGSFNDSNYGNYGGANHTTDLISVWAYGYEDTFIGRREASA